MPKRASQGKRLSQKENDTTFTPPQTQSQDDFDYDPHVKKLVRYFIIRAGSLVPVRKSDIQKLVLPNTKKRFDQVLELAKVILDTVYGYKLDVSGDNTNTLQYIISNNLPTLHFENEDENDCLSDFQKIFKLLVLAHVFMSDNSCREASLVSFLSSLDIDINSEHEAFGNVKELVYTTMVRQKYLNMQTDAKSRKIFSWGCRAEKTVSKHEILKFVAKIHDNTNPGNWVKQYQAANEQVEIETRVPGVP